MNCLVSTGWAKTCHRRSGGASYQIEKAYNVSHTLRSEFQGNSIYGSENHVWVLCSKCCSSALDPGTDCHQLERDPLWVRNIRAIASKVARYQS